MTMNKTGRIASFVKNALALAARGYHQRASYEIARA